MSGLITVEDYNSAIMNYDGIIELVVDGSLFPEGETTFSYDFLNIHLTYMSSYVSVVVRVANNLKIISSDIPWYASDPSYNWYTWRHTSDISSFKVKMTFYKDNPFTYPSVLDGFVESFKISGCFLGMETKIKTVTNTVNTFLVLKKRGSSFRSYLGASRTQIKEGKYYKTFNIVLDDYIPLCTFATSYSGTSFHGMFELPLFKNPNFVNITGNLFIGKKDNTLTIEPFMTGTEENPITCKVRYLDKQQTFTLESSQTINVDLREYSKTTPLSLTVELSEGPYTNKETLTYEIPVEYQTINTQTQLINELTNLEGTQIIRLGANITLPYNNRIPILHDTIIIGNNKTLNLNHSSLVIQEGKTLKIQDTTLSDGDNAIIQKDNTTLELDGCTFQYCTSRHNEGLGSCVYCDIDLDSLTIPNDFTTNINNCTFRESYGAILHGGQLNITNSNYELTSSNRINTHSPYFLYQTDGEATLAGNVFDVDILENVYDCEPLLSSGAVTRYSTNAELITVIQSCRAYLAESDTEATIQDLFDTQGLIEDIHFCEATKNANQGQCLFALGENALINGQTHNSLTNPNNCNLLLNNASHIFMKYYYPEIEACVYISPMTGYETKALCYALSGLDWIYKVNAQITRASWQTENVNNPLREA